MANVTIISKGFVVDHHEHVQAFPKKQIEILTSGKRAASLPWRRRNKLVVSCVSTAAIGKTYKLDTWKEKQTNHHSVGSLVHDGLVYRENILIRSSEVGFDGKISLPTVSSYLQDTALNHSIIIGIPSDGLGATTEMARKGLIWVVSTIKIVMNRYLSWLDVVQVDTWMYQSGKNGLGRDWILRDGKTGEIVAHATSVFLLMNKKTRKLSKFAKEIKQELSSHLMDWDPVFKKDTRKRLQFDVNTADYFCTGLTPGWNDLDLNQHVNHAKYINWILQNVPRSMIEHHELSAITMEYLKECNTGSRLQSLSKVIRNEEEDDDEVELNHLLLLDNGLEILRGSSKWKLKRSR